MGIMIIHNGYNNGDNNPVYNVHTKTSVYSKTWYRLPTSRLLGE